MEVDVDISVVVAVEVEVEAVTVVTLMIVVVDLGPLETTVFVDVFVLVHGAYYFDQCVAYGAGLSVNHRGSPQER